MTYNPHYSIILPTYNSYMTIVSAIDSILLQSYKNYELIIVIDGSTDETYKLLQKYENNLFVKIITNENNIGAAKSINKAIELAQYDWIAIIDSDAVEPIDYLERANKIIESCPSVDMFGGMVKYVFDKNNQSLLQKVFLLSEVSLFPKYLINYKEVSSYGEPVMAGATLFFKKNVFIKLGKFNQTIRACHDRLLPTNAVEQGYTLIYDPILFIYHPLYNFKNVLNFFERTIIFTKWKNVIFENKFSYRMEQPYRAGAIIIVLFTVLSVGLVVLNSNIIPFLAIFGLFGIISYTILISHKFNMDIVGSATFVLFEITKKLLSILTYMLKLKPNNLDWKSR